MAIVPKYDVLLDEIREEDLGYGTADNPFPSSGFYMYDALGALQIVTISAAGAFVITPASPPTVTTNVILKELGGNYILKGYN